MTVNFILFTWVSTDNIVDRTVTALAFSRAMSEANSSTHSDERSELARKETVKKMTVKQASAWLSKEVVGFSSILSIESYTDTQAQKESHKW
jgi:hypothetical protein